MNLLQLSYRTIRHNTLVRYVSCRRFFALKLFIDDTKAVRTKYFRMYLDVRNVDTACNNNKIFHIS